MEEDFQFKDVVKISYYPEDKAYAVIVNPKRTLLGCILVGPLPGKSGDVEYVHSSRLSKVWDNSSPDKMGSNNPNKTFVKGGCI